MFNPALFIALQKKPEQKAKEAHQKMGDDFAKMLKKMTPEKRREFWKQHDTDTTASED